MVVILARKRIRSDLSSTRSKIGRVYFSYTRSVSGVRTSSYSLNRYSATSRAFHGEYEWSYSRTKSGIK